MLGLGYGFPNFAHVCMCMPDENLAVGDIQVVEYVNVAYAVFDKSTGAAILGPVLQTRLWSGFSGRCADDLSSDVIVQWDKVAHRWLFAHNTGGTRPPFWTCIAISTSADATGSYYRYQYASSFWDYPKWGTWTDGYYQTYYSGSGPIVSAYNRAKMLNGDPSAEMIAFQMSPHDSSLLPADIDSMTTPPANEDEFFIGSVGRVDNAHLSLYSAHIDWANPQNSTITGVNDSQLIAIAPFTPACNGTYGGTGHPCIPQLGTQNLLSPLGDRLMYRFAYSADRAASHIGSHTGPILQQHWVVSHTVTADQGQNAVRWYEFVAPDRAVPVTALSVAQQGTFAPDANHRFQSSIARDRSGNILVGYTVSGSSLYPEIAVAGRSPSDPAGTLEPEQVLFSGTASQDSQFPTWGDYSSMALDGADGCTFWYVGMYYATSTAADYNYGNLNNWSTRLFSAKFPNCAQ